MSNAPDGRSLGQENGTFTDAQRTSTLLEEHPITPSASARMQRRLFIPPSQNSSNRARPIREWKQTADGRVISARTLSEAHPTWLLEPSSEGRLPNAPRQENCVQAPTGATAFIGQISGSIAGLFALLVAEWSHSTAAHWH